MKKTAEEILLKQFDKKFINDTSENGGAWMKSSIIDAMEEYASQFFPPVSEEEIRKESIRLFPLEGMNDKARMRWIEGARWVLSRLPQRERHIPSDQEIRDMADNHARYGDGDQYLNDDQYEGFISGAAQMREVLTGIIISSDKTGSWKEIEQPVGKTDKLEAEQPQEEAGTGKEKKRRTQTPSLFS